MFYISADPHSDQIIITEHEPDPLFVKSAVMTLDEAMFLRGCWIVHLTNLEDLRRPLKKLGLEDYHLFAATLMPDGISAPDIKPLYDRAFNKTMDLMLAVPDAFDKLGRPWVWEYYFGLADSPPTEAHWKMWNQNDRRGIDWPRPSKPGRGGRPVRDLFSSQEWPSAADAADALGVHRVTIYHHLRGDPRYSTVKGRTLEWAPEKPLPGSWDAKTEEEKAASRALMVGLGYTPKV